MVVLDLIRRAPIYTLSVYETRDVSGLEQLTLTVRWVSDQYEVHEDFIGMYECEKADAETITKVIKDILIRCNFPMISLRGQTYDGASALQGKISGVATKILQENPKVLSIHCLI